MGKNKQITLNDVAQKAGVSTSTVSRVLNNRPSIREEIRDRVYEAVRDLNYVVKKVDRGQNGLKDKMVAVIIPEIINIFFPLLIKGIVNVADQYGYNTILYDSENSAEYEANHLRKIIKMNIDGLIYSPTASNTREIRIMMENNFPVVFLDRVPDMDNICCVIPDNFEGSYQAVKYLLGLGHRRIVLITGPKELSTESSRLEGYKQALAEEKIQYNKDLYIQGDFQFESSYHSTKNLLEREISFSAIIAVNDLTSFGARKALEEKGYKIPEDISMIGLDNDNIRFSSSMGLTSIIQPTFEMGKNAMLVLIGLIEGRIKPPHRIVLRPSIAIKDSCRMLVPK